MGEKTIVSMGLSRCSRGDVSISIEDAHSGDRILDVDVTPEELGLLITGLYGVKGRAEIFTGANIAKEREVMIVTCCKVDRGSQGNKVLSDFCEKYLDDGWEIQNDGTSSQQNGSSHEYVIKKYKDVEDINDVKLRY